MPHSAWNLALLSTLSLIGAQVRGFSLHRGTRHLCSVQRSESVRTESSRPPYYVIVMDAGSTSTKANVFEFVFSDAESSVPTAVNVLSDEGEVKIKPGLHTYEDDVDGLTRHISTVFHSLNESLVRRLPSSTPVYFMATEGMRRLQESNSPAAGKLLQAVGRLLTEKSINPFSFTQNNLRLLTGKEEAAYAWIAANFLKGFFQTSSMKDSVGFLEMGGASMQVVFQEDNDEGCYVQLADRHRFPLYARSFPDFGGSGILKRVYSDSCGCNDKAEANSDCRVDSPCMLKGDTQPFTCEDNDTVSLVGTSDLRVCRQKLTSLLNTEVGGSRPGPDSMEFYAAGAFRFPPETFRAIGSEDILDFAQLEREVDVYCKKTLQEVAEEYMNGQTKFASVECTQGLLIAMVLQRLGLDSSVIRLAEEIDSKIIGWALGAALTLTAEGMSLHCE